jgi:hypothetical protein
MALRAEDVLPTAVRIEASFRAELDALAAGREYLIIVSVATKPLGIAIKDGDEKWCGVNLDGTASREAAHPVNCFNHGYSALSVID